MDPAMVSHYRILEKLGVNEEADQQFIIMQYVDGETLAQRDRRKRLSQDECIEVAIQVADALSMAHSNGIIHRDIKPQNIMLTTEGQVKVLDFGLAMLVAQDLSVASDAQTQSLLTQPGVI